jgi:hypothetical protein
MTCDVPLICHLLWEQKLSRQQVRLGVNIARAQHKFKWKSSKVCVKRIHCAT